MYGYGVNQDLQYTLLWSLFWVGASVQLHFAERLQSVHFLGRFRPIALQKCINAGEDQFGSLDPRHVSCTGNTDQAAVR